MGGSDGGRLAASYDDFGRNWARGTSPLYENWATGIARDEAMLSLIGLLPPAKRQPNLIFAAARLAGCATEPYDAVRDAMLQRWPAIADIALTRSTQTNEVGRCATWLPPLSRIDGPVALLEVGAAAGLCLYPDRVSVDYDTPDGPVRHDPPSSAGDVVLRCRLDDAGAAPTRVPDVVWRRGIDLHPIDIADPAALEWLTLLVWPGPDHDERVARLRAAASLVAADPPEIVRGDLLDLVTDVAAEAPADATVVVFHSAVLLYLDAAQKRRFADLMAGLGRAIGPRVVWLSSETRGTLAEIDAALPPGLATDHRFVQTRDAKPIALAGQHGATYETRPFATASRPAP